MESAALLLRLLLIGVVLALAAPGAARATDAGVVRIEAQVGGKTRFGSGFVVGVEGDAAYVATAAHVVEGDPAPGIYFRSRPHSAIVAQVVAIEGGDPDGLALLRVGGGLPAGVQALPMAAGGGADLAPGQAVTALGIPASIRSWAVLPGAVIAWKNRNILFSGGVDEGSSGGPLLAGSAVVGVVMRAGRFGEAVPAQSLRLFLRSNRVVWEAGAAAEPAPAPSLASPTPAVPQRPRVGETFRDCDDCPEMAVIPAGSFRMGSPDGEKGRDSGEGPVHTVTFERPFALARHEVTFDQWDACVLDGGCSHKPDDKGWGRGDRPVIDVSWEDAREYVAWLTRKTGKQYRLPSEAEWEYAARAGSTTARFWGDDSDAACRYANVYDETSMRENQFAWTLHACDDGYIFSAPVGRFAANAFGLVDMLGNVWEWTEDCWSDSYEGAPSDGSALAKGDCGRRVYRGGSWLNDPEEVRSAFRDGTDTEYRIYFLGFRPARSL